jgi:hypothetical protein
MSTLRWMWRFEPTGLGLDEEAQRFPSQAEAETWLGENWRLLAEDGVAAVTLVEDERDVYGPMPLSAG